MTLDLPLNTAMLFITAPMTIRANATHPQRGAAKRQRNKVEEAK